MKQEAPPLPRRSRKLDSGLLNDQDRVLYAQLRKQSPSGIPRLHNICQNNVPEDNPGRSERSTTQHQNIRRCSPPSVPHSVYSELGLLDGKSRSPPLWDNSSDGEQSYRLSAPPHTPPRLSPKPVRHVTCYDPPPEKTDSCSRPSSSRHSLENMSDSAVYHLAGRPGSPHTTLSETRSEQHWDSVYAEVLGESLIGRFPHANTYEMNRGHEDAAKPKPNSDTYEPVEDIIRPQNKHPSWGLKVSNVVCNLNVNVNVNVNRICLMISFFFFYLLQNDKWKWLFPEVKRKWWRIYQLLKKMFTNVTLTLQWSCLIYTLWKLFLKIYIFNMGLHVFN